MQACQAANSGPVQMGNVGAGAGARSGGFKGGLGTASAVLTGNAAGIVVGAIVAVNSGGRTFDANGNFFAGFLELGNEFDTVAQLELPPLEDNTILLRNTTIAVIATNATLTKAQITKVTQMADDGLARAIRPSHGVGDGDTIFGLATGKDTRNAANLVSTIGAAAADVLSRAVVKAILAAKSIHVNGCNVTSYCEAFPQNCGVH